MVTARGLSSKVSESPRAFDSALLVSASVSKPSSSQARAQRTLGYKAQRFIAAAASAAAASAPAAERAAIAVVRSCTG
jgi:hypothetical protein